MKFQGHDTFSQMWRVGIFPMLAEHPMVAKIHDTFLHVALQEAVLFCSLLQPGLCVTFSEEILSILFWHVLTFSMLQAVLISTRNSSIREDTEKLPQSLFLFRLRRKCCILKSEIIF